MSTALKFAGVVALASLWLPGFASADTQTSTQNTHHVHKAAKKQEAELPPPLPSGTQGPVPQVPLDAMPAVAPQVSYQDGLLTIVAPNSTLAEILRSVKKHTQAEIEVPASASERVVTRLGPAPAREVMAELLNGSKFNYILLGSPENSNALVRVVLVAKTPDTPASAGTGDANAAAAQPAEAADNGDAQADDAQQDDAQEQPAAEAEQQNNTQEQQKTPQQMLQEMQQRQMQGQQPGQPPFYPGRPGIPMPQQQQQPQQDQ